MNLLFSAHGNGKLLLSGEYFVLDGAVALALPTRLGQSFEVREGKESGLSWKSMNVEGECWFQAGFSLPSLQISHTSDEKMAETLLQMLSNAQALNPDFLGEKNFLQVTTHLEFPRDWGLGSSSTLLYALAKWAGVDPFQLSDQSLGGSGYDIACAGESQAILYQRKPLKPSIQRLDYQPIFSKNIWFVHLGKKQNSREGIRRYRSRIKRNTPLVEKVGALTARIQAAQSLPEFEAALLAHETLIAEALDMKRAKDLYFGNYWGEIKSLGAWGGDFVLASSHKSEVETKAYFENLGFCTVLSYKDLIL